MDITKTLLSISIVAFINLYSNAQGNVGIGTSTPTTRLDVVGVISATGGSSTDWNHAYSVCEFIQMETINDVKIAYWDYAYGWVNYLVGANTINYIPKWDGFAFVGGSIYDNGNVGIGTNNPGGLLELGLDQGRKPSTNTWTIASDERLKNISGSYNKGLAEILKLEPIKYYYKNVERRVFTDEVLLTENVGFSAQAVQKVFPESVGRDDDGYLNFNMHAILVAQVNAIKEQQKLIKKQQEQITELQNSCNRKDNLQAVKDELMVLINQLQKENKTFKDQLAQFEVKPPQ